MTTCLCISRNHFMVKEKTIWEEKKISICHCKNGLSLTLTWFTTFLMYNFLTEKQPKLKDLLVV